jgi:hypothetical protein
MTDRDGGDVGESGVPLVVVESSLRRGVLVRH